MVTGHGLGELGRAGGLLEGAGEDDGIGGSRAAESASPVPVAFHAKGFERIFRIANEYRGGGGGEGESRVLPGRLMAAERSVLLPPLASLVRASTRIRLSAW